MPDPGGPRGYRAIVLWDLDGTLISAGASAGSTFARAVRESGHASVPDVDVHGKTDLAICAEYLGFRRPYTDSEIARARGLLEVVERLTAADSSRIPAEREVCPGIPEFLRASSEAGVGHALVTGNSRSRAKTKLEAFGLWDRFLESVGAFGDQSPDRADLLERALARIRDSFSEGGRSPRAVVVGDTPADVEAARRLECPVVAVATGVYSVSELAEHDPDLVVSSVRAESARVLGFVLEG